MSPEQASSPTETAGLSPSAAPGPSGDPRPSQGTSERSLPRGPLTRFTVFVVLAFLVALGAYALLTRPSPPRLGLMALVLLASAVLSILVGQVAYRLSWLRKSRRILWTVVAGYAVVGVLTLLGVVVTALLMFISTDDVRLVAALLLFGVGIAVSFGYLLAARISHDAGRLVRATDQVAQGRFDTRVEPLGKDEMADLARAFNHMTQALAEAAEKQHAVDRTRRDLVAWAGHDLRTPLASVTVIVEALADGLVTDAETAARYLRTAQRDLQVLTLLIDDLSLLAQIDAEGLRPQKKPDSLDRLVAEIADSFSLPAEQKEVELRLERTLEQRLLPFDALLLGRALTNLLDNAMRHVPEAGHIQVNTAVRPGAVEASIWNDGPPVAPADLPHLFDRFYRGDKSRGRSTGRAGLGLAIAKAIVEAHGGTIDVDTGPERGTRFTVSLPLEPPSAGPTPT